MRHPTLSILVACATGLLGVDITLRLTDSSGVAHGQEDDAAPAADPGGGGRDGDVMLEVVRGPKLKDEYLIVYDDAERSLASYTVTDEGFCLRGVRRLDYDFIPDEFPASSSQACVSRARMKKEIEARKKR